MEISSQIILDSIVAGHRITAIHMVYPRFILPEINTYRKWSRNTSSSRGKKYSGLSNHDHGYMPKFYSDAAKMQNGNELTDENKEIAEIIWRKAKATAEVCADKLSEIGVHRQHVNRLIEPFMFSNTLVSSTEYRNFFRQRLQPDVQPEMHQLALKTVNAYDSNRPFKRHIHLPYIGKNDNDFPLIVQLFISAVRCARVSYFRAGEVGDDLTLAKRLLSEENSSLHLSPFEFQAFSYLGLLQVFGWKFFFRFAHYLCRFWRMKGNYETGIIQFRKLIEIKPIRKWILSKIK